MYIYLLYQDSVALSGAYLEIEHVYMRIMSLYAKYNDDIDYYDNQGYLEKLSDAWTLYKVPVGADEEVYINHKYTKSPYLLELPDTYADLRKAIREFKIDKLI